jgi:hypothetical protein
MCREHAGGTCGRDAHCGRAEELAAILGMLETGGS